MGTHMFHAERCARSEATLSHCKVVRCFANGAALADSRVRVEVRGLSDSSDVRPTDINTIAALSGRDTALDVTATSPESTYAGQDCVQSIFNRKIYKYGEILPELF